MATAAKTQDTAIQEAVTQVQHGGQNAIGAVRRFLVKVDETIAGENSPTFVHELADSALDLSDRMVEVGGDAIRGIAGSVSGKAA